MLYLYYSNPNCHIFWMSREYFWPKKWAQDRLYVYVVKLLFTNKRIKKEFKSTLPTSREIVKVRFLISIYEQENVQFWSFEKNLHSSRRRFIHTHTTYSLFCETLHLCSLYVVLSPENLHSFAKHHPFILSRKSKIVVLCRVLGQKKSAEMDGVIDQSILQQS